MKVAAPALPGTPAAVERRVALLGFTPVERHQMQTVLRLAGARTVRYRLVDDAAEAELAVADADDEAAMASVRSRGLVALLVGQSQPDGAARLARPINVAQVVRSLDTLVRRGSPPTPAPVPRAPDAPARVPRPRARVLLAAGEHAGTRLLLSPLQRAGCEVQRVHSGAEAIERARTGGFQLVVIDAALDGLDGYHACRSIKRRAEADGSPAPTVVLIAAGPAAVNRVRAELAGADRLLEPPFDGDELLALLPPG